MRTICSVGAFEQLAVALCNTRLDSFLVQINIM